MIPRAAWAVAATLLVAAGSAAGTQRVWYSEDGFQVVYKPTQFTVRAGGAHDWLGAIRWRRWGGQTAEARGRYHNSGDSWKARITLSHRTNCGGRRVYLRRDVRIAEAAPAYIKGYARQMSLRTPGCPPNESPGL